MIDFSTSVGLDVHARTIKAVAIEVATGEKACASFGYDPAAVAEWVGRLPQPARCCYESGVTGFDLQRRLEAMGVDCVVGAVSKMIKPAADRGRKNDRNDAEFLARMLSVGNVVPVWVPDPGCEGARDLSRALADAREESQRSKQLLSKFLLRNGFRFDERYPTGARVGNWTRRHWEWIRSISMEDPAAQETLEYYVRRCERAVEERGRLESMVRARAEEPRWKARVDALKCLKGIDAVTAFAVVVEAGEFSRFPRATSFAAWMGLAPSEHSSGGRTVRGGITKAGNKHLRRLMVEAAWHYSSCSPHQKALSAGQEVSPEVRAHAGKGVRRLAARRRAMADRLKPACAANCATARELACWCWAVGSMAEAAE